MILRYFKHLVQNVDCRFKDLFVDVDFVQISLVDCCSSSICHLPSSVIGDAFLTVVSHVLPNIFRLNKSLVANWTDKFPFPSVCGCVPL